MVSKELRKLTGEGRKAGIGVKDMARMKQPIEEQPDIILEEIKKETGLEISVSAIRRKVHNKPGFNCKKNALRRRAGRRKEQEGTERVYRRSEDLPTAHLVFPDESGITADMTGRYGWVAVRKRCHDSAPVNREKKTANYFDGAA
jgi:hypothetical protein